MSFGEKLVPHFEVSENRLDPGRKDFAEANVRFTRTFEHHDPEVAALSKRERGREAGRAAADNRNVG